MHFSPYHRYCGSGTHADKMNFSSCARKESAHLSSLTRGSLPHQTRALSLLPYSLVNYHYKQWFHTTFVLPELTSPVQMAANTDQRSEVSSYLVEYFGTIVSPTGESIDEAQVILEYPEDSLNLQMMTLSTLKSHLR